MMLRRRRLPFYEVFSYAYHGACRCRSQEITIASFTFAISANAQFQRADGRRELIECRGRWPCLMAEASLPANGQPTRLCHLLIICRGTASHAGAGSRRAEVSEQFLSRFTREYAAAMISSWLISLPILA